ncbi:Uu.00g064800.m01.CDS01 [Anthostomella pinea]|uniref:Uu.00g064800.m01.CDS01 n=1 Tax=Anthostomella pinea TaxID=933095 RepID=A0AAI8VU92_9PEZI|nr:Uu.00g064800.m01.CDS01 [Anthostomella pinea]
MATDGGNPNITTAGVVKPDSWYYAARDEAVLRSCCMCDGEAPLQCQRCSSRYCSRSCQEKDFPTHQHLCRLFGRFGECDSCGMPRPTPFKHVLGMYFPDQDLRPQLVWIRIDPVQGPLFKDHCYGFFTVVDNHLVEEKISDTYRDANVSAQPLLDIGRGLRCYIHNRDTAWQQHINWSVLALAPPGHAQVVYESVIFCAFTSDTLTRSTGQDDPVTFEDVTPRDYRKAIDMFTIANPLNPCITDIDRFPLGPLGCKAWPAVKVNCAAEIERFSAIAEMIERFPSIAADKELLSSDFPSKMPDVEQVHVRIQENPQGTNQLSGLPWVWSPCATNLDFPCNSGNPKSYNKIGQHITAVYHAISEGKTAEQETRSVELDAANGQGAYGGTILVMHYKGAPIASEHVTAFHQFIEETRVVYDPPIGDTLSRRGCEAFWDKWVEQRRREGVDMSGVASPYAFEWFAGSEWE